VARRLVDDLCREGLVQRFDADQLMLPV